jgi:hypothetical protein
MIMTRVICPLNFRAWMPTKGENVKKLLGILSLCLVFGLTSVAPARAGACSLSEGNACNGMCSALGGGLYHSCSAVDKQTCWGAGPGHIQCGIVHLVSCVCSITKPLAGSTGGVEFYTIPEETFCATTGLCVIDEE